MERDQLKITIAGKEVDDLYPDLVSLEVELDDDLAAMFRLHIAIAQQDDGTWTYLDDERFRVWQLVTITAGLESGTEDLISGYITHVNRPLPPI